MATIYYLPVVYFQAVAQCLPHGLGQTAYFNPATGIIDADWSYADMEAVEAEVNTALAASYEIPVTQPAAVRVILTWCSDLWRERAYLRLPDSPVPDAVAAAAANVRAQLQAISSGARVLPGIPIAEDTSEGSLAGAVVLEMEEPELNRTNLAGW